MPITYVLETTWTWDETHRELCTFVVEDYELEHNDPAQLFKPDTPTEMLNVWLRRFKQAAEAQNGCPMRPYKLVRLWSAEVEAWDSTRAHTTMLRLTPVGEFGEQGIPLLKL